MTTDNNDIRALLGLTFEIEGLLMLKERRAEMTPAEVSQMLIDKCARLMDGVASLTVNRESSTSPAEDDEPVAPVRPLTAEAVIPDDEITTEDNEIAEAAAFEETADADIEPLPVEEEITEVVEEIPVAAPDHTAASAKPAKTISLTLNDRFRFRRTLFGGSDSMMNETVAALGAITNPDDIADFITNDLCWNMDDPEVADFLAIVEAAR